MRVNGRRNIENNLNSFRRRTETLKESLIKVTALQIATDAKTTLNQSPADYSRIAQSISANKVSNDKWTVNINELPMGAYVEFGTGTFVEIPQGWEETAMQFYVNGKGYLHAYPYLIPAYNLNVLRFKEDFQQGLNRLLEQYNR